MKRLAMAIICGGLLSAVSSMGTDLASMEKGKQLFTSKELGTSGKSCSSCHPDGKKLEGIGSTADEELAATINACIAGPLKGKKLDPESSDMKALVLYLRSFANSGK